MTKFNPICCRKPGILQIYHWMVTNVTLYCISEWCFLTRKQRLCCIRAGRINHDGTWRITNVSQTGRLKRSAWWIADSALSTVEVYIHTGVFTPSSLTSKRRPLPICARYYGICMPINTQETNKWIVQLQMVRLIMIWNHNGPIYAETMEGVSDVNSPTEAMLIKAQSKLQCSKGEFNSVNSTHVQGA